MFSCWLLLCIEENSVFPLFASVARSAIDYVFTYLVVFALHHYGKSHVEVATPYLLACCLYTANTSNVNAHANMKTSMSYCCHVCIQCEPAFFFSLYICQRQSRKIRKVIFDHFAVMQSWVCVRIASFAPQSGR
jgi:hypothetical protein